MKELSIEEKAKRYDEAIEKFEVVLNLNTVKESGTIFADDVRKIFPELKESEDEKIRKELLSVVNDLVLPDEQQSRFVAWLEKQGEQSPKNTNKECLKGIKRVQEYQDLSDWEKKFDNIASMYAHNKNQEGYNESWYVKERAAAMLYHAKKELKKQGEQKPAEWHREDEQNLNACLGFIPDEFLRRWLNDVIHVKYDKPAWSEEDDIMVENIRNSFGLHCGQMTEALKEQYDKFFNKVKSLRPQNRWKPSDEQIKGIKCAIKTLQHQLNVGDKRLNSLYDDLKKLREE